MFDRLTFWLLLAVAFVATLALAVVGPHPMTLLAILQVPAVLVTLLAMRATVRLATGRPTALVVGSRRVLGGWPGLLVPLALLTGWTVLRETGVVSAQFAATSHRDGHHTNWYSSTDGLSADLAPDELEVTGGDGALHERLSAGLRRIGQAVADHRVVGRIEVATEPPFALLPLWKTAAVACKVHLDLVVRDGRTDEPLGKLIGTVEITGDWTMLGFGSQRDFHLKLAESFAKKTRDSVVDQIQKLRKKPS